jgi:DNA transformation protein
MDQDSIRDIFREAGLIRLRRMFGGQGIYRDDLMFALEFGGELFLKVDDATREFFGELGSRPFTYTGRNGKPLSMSYWRLPESALDDPEEAARLAELAVAAARRASAGKVVSKTKARR